MSEVLLQISEGQEAHDAPRASLVSAANRLLDLTDRLPAGICRFLVAGGLSSLINWLARFPLSAGLPYGAAVAVAYAVGMVAGFGLYRSWVFPGSTLSVRDQALRFILVNMIGLSCVVAAAQGLAVMIGSTGWVGLSVAEASGHGLAIVLGAIVNFTGHRAITFTRLALSPRHDPLTGGSRVAVKRLSR